MRKTISLLVAVACLLAAIPTAVLADGATWTCPTCGQELSQSYNFCPNDATARPSASAGSWPVWTLGGTGTSLRKLKSSKDRHQSYLGPSKSNYHGAGAYKPYKVTSATALFREGDYVLVDMSYTTVGRRCVYFRASSLTNSSVEQVSLTPHAARTTGRVQPYYGPGTIYDRMTDDNRNDIMLSSGTRISVYFEVNGWVFAEFQTVFGSTRGWIPANMVQAM